MSRSTAFAAFSAVCTRDLRLIWRRRGDAAQPVLFALIVITPNIFADFLRTIFFYP